MRLRTFPAILFGFTTVAALVAGCSSDTPGTANPSTTTDSGSATASASSTTTSGSGGSSTSAAPKVSGPLDASRFVSSNCSALTASQVVGLGLTGAISKSQSNYAGTGCTWTDTSGKSIGIGWETGNKNGLSDLYSQRSSLKYFEETTVNGYPAVYADTSDNRSSGECVLNVGISDQLYFITSADSLNNPSQACGLVQQAASDVIKNLGGA